MKASKNLKENNHFENMRANLIMRCQNSLRQTPLKIPTAPKFQKDIYAVGKKLTENGCKMTKLKGCLF